MGLLNRVLIVPASYPPVLGGVQTVAHRLACHLEVRGWAVAVLTRRHPRSLARAERIDGIQVTRRAFFPSVSESLGKNRPDLALARVLCRTGDRRVLRGILRREEPRVVNIHFPDWQVGLIPQIRSIFSGRLVISLHGDEVMRAVRDVGGQRKRLLAALREADRVTACSNWLLERACSLDPGIAGKSTVIWNGIDADHYSAAKPMVRSRPYVLGFGRFVSKKGFDLLVEAFAGLKTGRGLDLVLVGSGPELERLRRFAAERGVGGTVHFPGRAFDADMVRWIRGACLAVVPSREEPFGMTALEVAAAGVPLVATSVGGMPEFLGSLDMTSGMVRLCEPDSASIREAMEATLESPPDPDQCNAQLCAVRERFDWRQRLQDYEQVFAGA